MNGWLIYSLPDAERNRRNIGFYLEKSAHIGIKLELLYREYIKIGVFEGKLSIKYGERDIAPPDFAICRTIDPGFTRQLEGMGVRTFNDSRVAEIAGDKARTYQYLAGKGVPMPDTLFWRWDGAAYGGELGYPVVAKPCGGRGGYAVELIADGGAMERYRLERRERREDFVIQRVAGAPGRDLRVYVIGGEPVAAMLRVAEAGDIRANFCLGGRAERYRLSGEERATVERVAREFDFGFVGVDFLFDTDGSLLLNEIEDVVGARMLYIYTDIDPVQQYLEYIKDILK